MLASVNTGEEEEVCFNGATGDHFTAAGATRFVSGASARYAAGMERIEGRQGTLYCSGKTV